MDMDTNFNTVWIKSSIWDAFSIKHGRRCLLLKIKYLCFSIWIEEATYFYENEPPKCKIMEIRMVPVSLTGIVVLSI